MKDNARLVPELAFAALIFAGCGWLLLHALDLPAMSALLPVAMLVLLMVLAAIRAATVLMRGTGPTGLSIDHPLRAAGGFAVLILYAFAVQLLGFYTSTIVMLPLVAWIFGYRNPRGLALATVLFVGGIYIIFSLLMGQRFPEEFFQV